MKLILLIFTIITLSLAHPIVNIESDNSDIKDFSLSYLIDKTDSIEFDELQSFRFSEGKNRDSLGENIPNVWIKIALHNQTDKPQLLFLHQDLAYRFVSLEYYEVDSKQRVIREQKYRPFTTQAKEQLTGADAIFSITLLPQESKTIYIDQKSPAFQFYNYLILSQKESIRHLIYEKVDSVLIVGLLLALSLYNFFIYISSKYREYLYYSLYLLSSTLWIFYVYGSMAHYFQIYGEIPLRFNFGIMLAPLFLSLFIQTLFKTKTDYKIEHTLLQSIIALSLANALYGLIDFKSAVELLTISLSYALLIFMWISISLLLKGDKLIKIFLYAHTLYLIFSTYSLLYYMGLVDANYFSSHGTGVGVIIEALLLSYLVSHKFTIMQEQREQERLKQIELHLLASTDSMTKLYNRRYFNEISKKVLDIAKREQSRLSLLMIDIDNFKRVNDSYGHQFGDEVLIMLSRTLTESQRESDIICRYGGEEFVVLLPKSSLQDATGIAQNIRKLIESLTTPLPSNSKEFKFTLSIGVAEVDKEHEENLYATIKRADDALYQAKKSGRNRVCTQEDCD